MNKKLIIISALVVATFGYAVYHAFVLSNKLDSSTVVSRNSVISQLPKVDLEFYQLDRKYGDKLSLSSLYNKSLHDFSVGSSSSVVHFWATWCGPCEEEFPHLIELADKLTDNSESEINFILVAVSDKKNEILKFLKKYDFRPRPNLFIAVDNTSVSQDYFGTFKLPETFYFDSKGVLIRKFSGAQDWAAPVFLEYFTSK